MSGSTSTPQPLNNSSSMESKTSSRPSSSSSSHPQSPDSTIYHIYFDNIVHTNFTITKSPAKQTPLYYVQNSYFTPNTPDMTLHAGTNQSGPLLAQCKFVLFSTGTKIGLGNGVDDMIWEDLTRESKDHSRYRYEIDLDMDEDESGNVTVSKKRSRPRRAFLWKRTHSVGVDDSMPSKLSTSNFKLVEEETGEVVAVFANNGAKSWRKKGKLEILHKEGLVGKGRRFELMVLMGALAVVERERRRGMQWRYDQL